MPYGFKNALSEFHNIMNDIFIPYSEFTICYIDDVIVYSSFIEQHIKISIFLRMLLLKMDLLFSHQK